jgi:hypothetical protein
MSAQPSPSGLSGKRMARWAAGALAAALLLSTPVLAVVAAPWGLPGGDPVVIEPADRAGSGGLDVLEPRASAAPKRKPNSVDDREAEREARTWTYTDGGGGHGHPSPGH